MMKNFSFLLSKSPIRFCHENPIRISRRAKRGEPSKLAISFLVLGRGLEPPRVAPPAPKAGASTTFATPAYSACYIIIPCRHKSHLPVARCARDPGSLARQGGGYLRLGQKQKSCRREGFLVLCPPTRIRTSDHLLKRELLYQLSYGRLHLFTIF